MNPSDDIIGNEWNSDHSKVNDIITSTREFINCEKCNKDMQGIMEYETEMGGRMYRPKIICMRCYYKKEIDELESE